MCYLLFHELHELLGLYGAHLAVSPKLDAERKYRLTFGEYSQYRLLCVPNVSELKYFTTNFLIVALNMRT